MLIYGYVMSELIVMMCVTYNYDSLFLNHICLHVLNLNFQELVNIITRKAEVVKLTIWDL